MTNPQPLAQEYAVVRDDGVVIDRLLLSDLAYESIDWASRYPDCHLELDDSHSKPIGFGGATPELTPEDVEERERQYRQQLAERLTGAAKESLLQSLSAPSITEPRTDTAE